MIYLILGLCVINTFVIGLFFLRQNKFNNLILNSINLEDNENESHDIKNKKHIDDMLKMREMYESD
tara:strand:+ start:48492 stop:48689 length:198 start_codon:yes stop_codon:yes gene_type:complete